MTSTNLLHTSYNEQKMTVFIGRSVEMDRQSTIILDVLSNWYALKRGTFLVLEATQEYENSGNYDRVQGKYLPVIRRHILWNDVFLSEDNGYYQRLWKTIKDYGWFWTIIERLL